MGCVFGKKQVPVEEDEKEEKELPMAEVVEVAKEVKAVAVTEEVEPVTPEEFYGKFNFQFDKALSAADKELLARKDSPEDRILDLLLIMDCTSSMSTWIELCSRTLVECIDSMIDSNEELKVRVAFVGYRDFGDKNNIFVIQDFTFEHDKMKELIEKTAARGGQDVPEDLQGALYHGLQLSWREVSVKVCYLCTDAPAHGKLYHSVRDHYPKGNPAGLILEDLMEEYNKKEIDFTMFELVGITKNMFDKMEKAYKAGNTEAEIKRLPLEKDIKEAEDEPELLLPPQPLSISNGETVPVSKPMPASGKRKQAAFGGKLESAYRTNFYNDLNSRAKKQYARHGWSNYNSSKFKKVKRKAKVKY